MARTGHRFDVLILGGGTAGCILAARLSAEGSRSVCLLKSGPDYGPQGGGRWPPEMLDARAVPKSHDWGLEDDVSLLRPRIVGGCSAHNACFVVWSFPSATGSWCGPTGEVQAGQRYRPAFQPDFHLHPPRSADHQ